MEYNKLPGTDIKVSKICLGTMTWGRQNSDEEAFEQMDYSIDQGVNFFDTAELYPVPATPERYADTEKIIGNWITSRNSRDKIILASKIAGGLVRRGSMTLISHFPLPSMPFQTHDNIVFEKADKDRSSRNNEEFKPEQPNKVTPDTPVEDLKIVNQMYAYNPDPNKLRKPDGQIVDFIVA